MVTGVGYIVDGEYLSLMYGRKMAFFFCFRGSEGHLTDHAEANRVSNSRKCLPFRHWPAERSCG
jgi:hypothetical protein